MPRNITPAVLAAFSSNQFQPALFVQMQFTTSTVYVWTGFGSITWNGQTWIGVGGLLSVGDGIEDGSSVEARGITLTLSGIDPTLLPDCMSDVQLGLPVTIWMAAMSGGAPIPDPVMLWSGAMDQPALSVNANEARINLACENLLVSMRTPADRRYTTQDQQMDWPGDLGFIVVDALQEISIYWGTQATGTRNV